MTTAHGLPDHDPSRRRLLVTAGVAALGAALAACTGTGDDAIGATGTGDPGGTGTSGGTVAPSEAEIVTGWPVYGHDLHQTRTNVGESTITRERVASLRTTWSVGELVAVIGTPTVVDGVAHVTDWTGHVRTFDAVTGAPGWATPIGGMIVGAAAVDGDAVYASSGAALHRLDRATGAIVWSAATDDHPQAQISASPVVVDGLVLQGTASFENMVRKDEYLFRGSLAAFDAATGERRWICYATPGDATAGAGAGIWSTPAVDRARGLAFVGTGQGLSEPTPPRADSILAVDLATGEVAWSTQFTYPDVFSAANPTGKDADVGASPNLWTLDDGRELVGAGDKGGTYHALDRDTGAIVWETQLTPGSAFGGEIGSAALVDGLLVASSNVGDPATNAPTDVTHVFGLDPATGEKRWTSEALAGKIFAPVSAVPGLAFVGTDRGRLLAFDTETGATAWSMDAPAKTACGPSIVDGRILWGYGFTLGPGTGPGGLLALEVAP